MNMRTNKLNSTAKLAFYNARKRDGDVKRLAETTGYSVSHITNIMNGTRNINDEVANAMYKISARRQKVSEMA
jgi:plasmid maintenance system antidote protein VapI